MTGGRMTDVHAGTELDRAQRALREVTSPSGRTESVPLADARGHVLATAVESRANVPHYPRAAMDGYAIRAADAAGGSADDPATFELAAGSVSAGDSVTAGEAVRVHTGSEMPADADAVVRLERAEETADGVEVTRDVPAGKDVAPVGEDVREGQHLYDQGHRLRPSDLGLLKSANVREVEVYERPAVTVLPTGEEVVDASPDRGEVVDSNGLTVSQYVECWGGAPRYRDAVPDEADALSRAVRDAGDADLVVTIGGSSVGERDVVPEVVGDVGELLVHGVSIKPGHPVGVGVVDGTPVLLLPGYPVSSVVNAVQFLRPALAWLEGTQPKPLPAVRATLTEPVESDRGTRRYARVRLQAETADEASVTEPRWTTPQALESTTDSGDSGAGLRATPTTHSGAGVLSSVALADGWVEVPEAAGDLPAGTVVTVQDWEWHP